MTYRVKPREGFVPARWDVVDADGRFVALFTNDHDAALFAVAKDTASDLSKMAVASDLLGALWAEVTHGEPDDESAWVHRSIAEDQGKLGAYMPMAFWAKVRRVLGKEPKA